MSDLFQDVRYSVRSLLKQRAFTVSVVLTLGLGIGLITAVFSVTDAVLFRPLPFFEPDRLVELWERDPKQPIYQFAPGRNTVEFWRGQTRVFSRVEAYSWATFVVTGAGEPESLRAALASPGLFSALGVSPVLGRGLTDTDALTGSPQVMVISHTFWRTRFASAADAIGKTLMLNGQPHEVIGVMPERFAFPVATTLFWVPLSTTESGRVNAIARLPEDTSILAAQAAADTLTPVLASTDPKGPHSLRLIPLGEHRANKRPRQALLALLGAVGFVLLLTCANVANLLLARGAERQAEIAIRMAVGASRERLIRGLLTESLVLAAAGGLVGLGLAWVGVKVLAGMVPTEFTFLSVATIDMDPRVVAFTVAVAGLTAAVFGLAPALLTARADAHGALGVANARLSADRRMNRFRGALVVLEISLCVVLLTGAGLMTRSFMNLASQAPGFDPTNLIATELSLPKHRYPTKDSKAAFFASLKEAMRSVPGVASVSVASGAAPSSGGLHFDLTFEVEGRPPEPKDAKLILPMSRIDEDYFTTMKIPVLRGRGFPLPEQFEGQSPIIINESMARRFWGNENPVGARIRYALDGKWRTVVGVVGDVIPGPAGSGFSPMRAHYPFSRSEPMDGAMIVRATAPVAATIAAIRQGIRSLDKDQPIQRIDTTESLLGETLAEPRFYLRLLASFGLSTLLLVAMGIYGVMAHAVAQRTREIGIRVALGAQRAHVMNLVFRRALALTLMGMMGGVASAASLSDVLSSLLFGTAPTDALAFAMALTLMAVVALLAAWVPARRAASIDPLLALRHE